MYSIRIKDTRPGGFAEAEQGAVASLDEAFERIRRVKGIYRPALGWRVWAERVEG